MDEIYKKIKDLRLQNGYTLKELSERTDLSISFLLKSRGEQLPWLLLH